MNVITSLISILLLVHCSCSLILYSNGTISVLESVTVQYYDESRNVFESVFTNVTGEIVLGSKEDVEGKIALIPFNFGADEIGIGLRDRGAIGMIMGSTSSFLIGRAAYQFLIPRRSERILFPSVQISEADYFELRDKLVQRNEDNIYYSVSMTSDLDVDNPYHEVMKTLGPLATVLLAVCASATILLSFFILGLDIASNGHTCEVGIKSTLIVLILVWNIIKLFWSLSDFEGHDRQVGWVFIVFYQMVNIPLSIICILLLSLYWFETLTGILTENTKTFSVTKIPFLILMIIFLLMIITVIIMANSVPLILNSIISLVAMFYSLSWVALSIFHLIMAWQIDTMLRKISKNRKTEHVKSFLVKIVVISILDLSTVFLLLTIVAIPVWSTHFLSVFVIIVYSFLTDISPFLILTLFNWNVNAITSSKSKSKN